MNEITMKVQKRASEMQKDEKINAIYQSFDTEEEAKNWMYTQALITLMYSPEERIEMAKKKIEN